MTSFLGGLGLGLSLIVAIGAQNAFLLRQGIRRERVALVVAICAVSDVILIAAGVAGLGALIARAPWLLDAARWFGALFLTGYALLSAARAWRGGGRLTAEDRGPETPAPGASPGDVVALEAGGVATATSTVARSETRQRPAQLVLTVLAFTWLNPHVYLDTVVMVGAIAATHGSESWAFGVGAMCASVLWFCALGYGARHLGRLLRTPRAWRVLDSLIAVTMLAIACSMVLPVFGS